MLEKALCKENTESLQGAFSFYLEDAKGSPGEVGRTFIPMFGRESGQCRPISSTIRQEDTVCYSKISAGIVRLEPDIRNECPHHFAGAAFGITMRLKRETHRKRHTVKRIIILCRKRLMPQKVG